MPKRGELAGLYDPRQGGEALRHRTIRFGRQANEPPRTNCFAVYLIESGCGTVAVDAACHRFGPASLLFFLPYQYLRFVPEQAVAGAVIEFHANFLCVETFHAEVGCSGRLFNDPYGVPVLPLDGESMAEISELFARIAREQAERELAHGEVALAFLKILLIRASRLKNAREASCPAVTTATRHPVLARLGELIEENYRSWHAPAEYAEALHMTAKTLGRVVREQLGTTLTDLIRGRVLTHAKWQLLHTLRPVKEIALELGFGDELYFSRLFKKATGVSPSHFREFETTIRGGSNLSMSSSHAPIHRPVGFSDTSIIATTVPGTHREVAGD